MKAKERQPKTVIHLPLTFHWFDEMDAGNKWIEYREITPKWTKEIWERRDTLEMVIFRRGFTSRTETMMIGKIDKGPCPIEGWDKPEYYRIYYAPF